VPDRDTQIELAMPVIQALVMFWYNTDPPDIMWAVYTDPQPYASTHTIPEQRAIEVSRSMT
jgi:hypothetical protein